MDGSSSSPHRLRIGFFQEIGRRLGCLSASQHQRQHSLGRKHDLLWILSFHIREPDLGWHSRVRDRSQKAPCFSLSEEPRPLKLSLPLHLTILCTFVRASFGVEVQFDDLLKNPARFNHQEVTVKGLLVVEGDDNSLWQDTESLRRLDWKHWIHVYPDLSLPPYPGTNMSRDSPANLHWVKLTGVVDTTARGRIGEEPFGLLQKRIEILPGPRLKQFLTILAWFKNDSGREVNMEVNSALGTAWFAIPSGKVAETGIKKGKGTATAKNRSNKSFARCTLTPAGSERYFDREKYAYYYRVTKNTIDAVLPSEAKRYWRLYPYPDRD
jgi:hypothetical protein